MNIGDTVYLIRHARFTSQPSAVRRAVITRITPSGQIVLSDASRWKTHRFNSSEYEPIGDASFDTLTADIDRFNQAKAAIRASNLANKMRDVAWTKVEPEKLEQIAAILGIE